MFDTKSVRDWTLALGDMVTGRLRYGEYVVGSIVGTSEHNVTIQGFTVPNSTRGTWNIGLGDIVAHVRRP